MAGKFDLKKAKDGQFYFNLKAAMIRSFEERDV